jgi:hypothetical protein
MGAADQHCTASPATVTTVNNLADRRPVNAGADDACRQAVADHARVLIMQYRCHAHVLAALCSNPHICGELMDASLGVLCLT